MTREEAIDVLKHNYPSSCYEDLCKAVDMAIKVLEQPSAQPKIVRCGDCKWYKNFYTWNGTEHHVCVREASEPSRLENDFCSYAERKEQDDG